MLPEVNTLELLQALKADYGFKEVRDNLIQGKCPICGQKELFISTKEPWRIVCNRRNHCGYSAKTKDLYPHLWHTLEERYPATPTDPNATAKAYLHSRSLESERFIGEFEQGYYHNPQALGRPSTPTVKFYITSDKKTAFERFIEVIQLPNEERKAHFHGNYKGLWWQPLDFVPKSGERVFLVEGILDALSLIQSGHKAVALLSSNNFPEKALQDYLGLGVHWVLALDNDSAGMKANFKLLRQLQELDQQVELCVSPSKTKQDWNDLLKAGKGQISASTLEECFYQGRLLTSKSAKQKALEIHAFTHKKRFTLDFANQLYLAKYSDKEDEDPIKVELIANCKPEFLYFQRDMLTAESAYYLAVHRPNSTKPLKGVFSSGDISKAEKFKQALMNTGAGMMFTADTKTLELHQNTYWFPTGQPLAEIETVNFLGYTEEFNAWLFNTRAVYQGELYEVNQDDFFELADGRKIKTTFKQEAIALGTLEAHQPALWFNDFKLAFGVKGLTTLAYWAGTFLVQQIRKEHSSYPFLELSGEPGTGKTSILEFLWKLSGRSNYEGIDLAKATPATRWRSFEQVANLPVVMIEADRNNTSRPFDLNEFKGLYNGRGMRGTSPKNGGIETKEPPFRGALIMAQNAAIESDQAVMERIIRVPWDKTHFSYEGFQATKRLRALEKMAINGFMTTVITQERLFLDKFKEGYEVALQRLDQKAELTNLRIKLNHAQIMGLIHALKACQVLPLSVSDLEQVDGYLIQCCVESHQRLEADNQLIAEFWELYHYLQDETDSIVNHSTDSSRIAISLPEFESLLAKHKLKPLDMTALRRELPQSKRYPFIDSRELVWSKAKGKPVRCFVFLSQKQSMTKDLPLPQTRAAA